ncbi:MAG: serine/threonine protein kinase [Burkholderiales bacterium]
MLDLSNASPSASSSGHAGGPASGVPTQRPISQSASGTTWAAFDPTTPQSGTVTVKRYNIRFTDYLMRNGAALERLSRFEGQSHPGLPKLVRAGLAAGQITLLSEGLNGEPLDQAFADRRLGINADAVIEMIGQLARALTSLHAGGLMHLDVRPAAIVVDLKAQLTQFADWGHAVPIAGVDKQLGAIPGIAMDGVPYASAELLAGMTPEPSDDVFALACVAYELLSGAHPFARRSAADAIAQGLVPEPIANIDPVMNDALIGALVLRRESRRITMHALAKAFERNSRPRGFAALDAILKSAWDGSFKRGAMVGIGVGALIAATVVLLVRPDQVVRGKTEIAPSTLAMAQPAAAGKASTFQEYGAVAASTASTASTVGSSGVGSAPPSRSDSPTARPMQVETQLVPGTPGAPSLTAGPRVEGKPPAASSTVVGAQSDASKPTPKIEIVTPPSPLPVPAIGQASRTASSGAEGSQSSKTGERTMSVLSSTATHTQALLSCPQCSCAGLREKRFSEGKSLTWEEANFVLSVCGG